MTRGPCVIAAFAVAALLMGLAPAQPKIKGWGRSPNVDLSIDHDTKHGGAGAAAFVARADPNQPLKTMLQAFVADEYRGKRMRLSAYIKSQNVSTWAGQWMRVDTEKHSPSFDNMTERPIKGTIDWTKYEIILDVPEDAQVITFGYLVVGTGTLWVDDITFEPVAKDIAPTKNLDPNAPEFPELVKEDMRKNLEELRKQNMTKPANLDFED